MGIYLHGEINQIATEAEPVTETKTMISKDSIIVATKDQASCDLGGEVAILGLKDSVYYGLDPVGAFIWNLIQVPRTLSEVRDAIMEEYDVELERCERDLLSLLQQLEDKGLIEVSKTDTELILKK